MKFNSLSFSSASTCSLQRLNDDMEPILVHEASGIHLTDLLSGQKSYYRVYTSECNKGFSFTGDALVIEVKVENDTFCLEEFFTQGSPSVHTSQLVKTSSRSFH